MHEAIQQVIIFAREAHGDQQRKFTPEAYIAHPVRVMETCSKYTNDLAILAAALLHDVLEDTSVSKDSIRAFLDQILEPEVSKRALSLVTDLTDVYTKEKYRDWNRRKRKSKEAARLSSVSGDAHTIKYADIIDNSTHLEGAEKQFAEKFLMECRSLLRVINNGHQELYRIAITTVDNCIIQMKRGTGK